MLRKETADPDAPLPPVPLHLQPPVKRPSLDMKKDKEKDRSGSDELEDKLTQKLLCLCVVSL